MDFTEITNFFSTYYKSVKKSLVSSLLTRAILNQLTLKFNYISRKVIHTCIKCCRPLRKWFAESAVLEESLLGFQCRPNQKSDSGASWSPTIEKESWNWYLCTYNTSQNKIARFTHTKLDQKIQQTQQRTPQRKGPKVLIHDVTNLRKIYKYYSSTKLIFFL
jgi:hypothetical protein